MATLKQIKGTAIQFLDEDPVQYVGSWSSGGAMNTGRSTFGAAGTQTAGLAATGQTSSGNNGTTNVELYDGSSWTETTNVNTARRALSASGASNTDSLIFAGLGPLPSGSPSPSIIIGVTEDWNGSAWTEVSDLNTSRFYTGSAAKGTSTATLAFGGATPPAVNNVESWNGSSWTETTEINTARSYIYGLGVQTSAIAAAGFSTTTIDNVESWNGSSWTEIAEVNSVKHAGGSAGSSTDGIIFGGSIPGATAQTESWNGSVWTEVNDLAAVNETIRGNGASGSVAWASGGDSFVTTTQEWSFPPSTSTILNEGDMWFNSSSSTLKGYGTAAGIPSGSWGSGGNLNTARGDGLYGFGTTSAAGVAGGDDGTPGDSWVANTEIYNGSSWSEVADLNTARYFAIGSGGTTTAAIGVAGRTTANIGNTETWNGSAWTEVTDINTARRGVLSNQPPSAQTQILVYSGYTTTQLTNTESWDGTSWTELSDLNTGQYTGGDGGAGPSDAIAAGGQPVSPGLTCEFWDGSTWTEGADLNTVRTEGAASGATSTSVIFGGGNNPGGTGLDTVEYYNGTSWTEIADLADGGNGASHHIGSAHDTFFVGGSPPSGVVNSTEHFTATAAVGTITTS